MLIFFFFLFPHYFSPAFFFEEGPLAAWLRIRSSKKLFLSLLVGTLIWKTSPYSTRNNSCTWEDTERIHKKKTYKQLHLIFAQLSFETLYSNISSLKIKSVLHFLYTSILSWSYRRLQVARSSMGAKAGMELSRLRKVALKAGPTVSHHCPMWGMYKMLGEVRFASTKICRTGKHSCFVWIWFRRQGSIWPGDRSLMQNSTPWWGQ